MAETKQPDYTDFNWDSLKKMQNSKWVEMNAEFDAEGIPATQLWEGDIPGYDPALEQPRPNLRILPIIPGRGMFIICAGGGFMFKSSNEAKPVAEFFHNFGINAAVLDYRVQPYDCPASPAADGIRAVRFLRCNAERLCIPADKIAIGGFSAGGVLSGNVAVCYDDGDPDAADPVERVSSRPDAVLLLFGIAGARPAARGFGYDEAAMNAAARGDVSLRLRFDSPPFFIFQTHEDDPHNALRFGLRLADMGIPYEVHTFRQGPHGRGLFDGKSLDSTLYQHTSRWAELAAEWLRDYGF